MFKVQKRQRKLKTKTAIYLDYSFNGKRIQENTRLFYLHSKDNVSKEHNKKVDILFEKLKAEKITQLFEGKNHYLPFEKTNSNFIDYYKNYQENHKTKSRKLSACLKHLLDFTESKNLKFASITEEFLINFKNYLEQKVKGETPHGYFKALSRVLKQAKKEKYIVENPATDIRVARQAINIKNTLTLEEIEQLIKTECSNDIVKRAFLFSCFTGIRFGDIITIRWEDLKTNTITTLDFIQNKTNKPVSIPLNTTAIGLLGGIEKQGIIFKMPTSNGTNKVLKYWVKQAGINKKITFHCSRHSFATNVLSKTDDLLSVSKLLGHTSMKETQKYVRAIDSKLLYAVQSIEF